MIDLDAAIGTGCNDDLVELLAGRATAASAAASVQPERARKLIEQGAHRVIVGTAAFDRPVLEAISAAVGPERVIIALDSKGGHIVIKGWRESTPLTAEEVIHDLEPFCSGFLCTYVDKEGMLQGTDLDWFRRLRAGYGPRAHRGRRHHYPRRDRAASVAEHPRRAGDGDLYGRLKLDELASVRPA